MPVFSKKFNRTLFFSLFSTVVTALVSPHSNAEIVINNSVELTENTAPAETTEPAATEEQASQDTNNVSMVLNKAAIINGAITTRPTTSLRHMQRVIIL